MKTRFIKTVAAALAAVMLTSQPVYARVGSIGLFGGVSQGIRLPKTTELLLGNTSTRQSAALPYKEVIFITGVPTVFEGLLTVTTSGNQPSAARPVGTYNESYRVSSSTTTDPETVIDRNITFSVNYRVEGNQTIKDYNLTRWTESVTVGGTTLRIDPALSQFSVSVIEDAVPGATYYKGNISKRAVYTDGENNTTLEVSGTLYGYTNAWSSTETQRLNGFVYTDGWQMQYQVRPSVSVSKSLQYSQNEPTAISFSGNYQEVMQNLSGLSYNIFVKPVQFYDIPDSGSVSIPSYNTFEQLIAPDLEFLRGHPAEQDIRRLFSMQVLDGDPKFYQPSQAISRDQFVTALVRAIKLPVEPVSTNNRRNSAAQAIVFPDVTLDRPGYPYIMAAFRAGLVNGRSNGLFYSDYPLERQEAVVLLLRALGLQNLGLDPTPITPFVDDRAIADWAKREIYAAQRIGLVFGDSDGNFNPRRYVSKSEAAALINRMIDYMRSDIANDYSNHIVNFPD